MMLMRASCGRRQGRWLAGLSLTLLTVFGSGLGARVEAAQAAQTRALAGTVVAREGRQVVSGAVVVIEGTTLTAVANAIGRFRI